MREATSPAKSPKSKVKEAPPSQPPPPAELCGYAVVEDLSPAGAAAPSTFLAIGPGGRGVVLKRMDDDCLLGGQLHPSIRERLGRVRELALAGVANLHGVGKESSDGPGCGAWLIWEYVEGTPFVKYAESRCHGARDLAVLGRELILTIESLHLQGIVHGSIKSDNVIVGPAGAGSVRLTQISPYLYTDPADDTAAVVSLLDEAAVAVAAAQRRSNGKHSTPADPDVERRGPFHRLLIEADQAHMPLRTLAARLAALIESKPAPASQAVRRRSDTAARRRAVVGALVTAAAGVSVAWGVWHAAGEPFPTVPTPRWLDTWLQK